MKQENECANKVVLGELEQLSACAYRLLLLFGLDQSSSSPPPPSLYAQHAVQC